MWHGQEIVYVVFIEPTYLFSPWSIHARKEAALAAPLTHFLLYSSGHVASWPIYFYFSSFSSNSRGH
jgi:hypothetical protein